MVLTMSRTEAAENAAGPVLFGWLASEPAAAAPEPALGDSAQWRPICALRRRRRTLTCEPMTDPLSILAKASRPGHDTAWRCRAAPPQGTAGAQLGRLAGESMEFMDHREYQPGDDLRRLDWAAYARSDKMFVKLYRQEVCPHLDVVIDGSRSMALHGQRKGPRRRGLGRGLVHGGRQRGPHAPRVPHRPRLPADRRRRRIADALAGPGVRFAGKPAGVFPGASAALAAARHSRDSQRLALDGRPAGIALRGKRSCRGGPCDPDPGGRRPGPAASRQRPLADSESGDFEEVFLDAAALARYGKNLDRHRENWRRAARQVGPVFVPLVAEEFCRGWDFSPLVEAGILTV